MHKSILLLSILTIFILTGCKRNNDAGTKIITKDSLQAQNSNEAWILNEIIFVGLIENKSGLYKYNISTKSYSEFWHNDKEEVVEVSYSPDKKSIYFLTAHQSGKKGVFPFINKVKLYYISVDSGLVRFIQNIGGGLQVFSFWESDDTFKVILNVIDITIATEVDQTIQIFNASGNKISKEKKIYDLAKVGYPQSSMLKNNLTSPNKKFSICSIDSITTQIYLFDHFRNDKKILLANLNQKLNFVDWSTDEKLLFLSTLDVSPNNETLYDEEPATSNLLVYSLEDKRIIKMFEGGGVKNYMIDQDILLFDDGFKAKSKLYIYNFRSGQMIDTVKIMGGCGLKNIPTIPDYGA